MDVWETSPKGGDSQGPPSHQTPPSVADRFLLVAAWGSLLPAAVHGCTEEPAESAVLSSSDPGSPTGQSGMGDAPRHLGWGHPLRCTCVSVLGDGEGGENLSIFKHWSCFKLSLLGQAWGGSGGGLLVGCCDLSVPVPSLDG